jgi:hypothetical protein
MSQNLNEKLEHLDELIRKVSSYLDPTDRYEYLNNDDQVEIMHQKFPQCFVTLGRTGREPHFLPICNRAGIIDPKVVAISMKVVQNFMDNPLDKVYDINDLQKILDTLQRLQSRYDKDIPKPPDVAARKGVVTRMFNNIKGYLDQTRGK